MSAVMLSQLLLLASAVAVTALQSQTGDTGAPGFLSYPIHSRTHHPLPNVKRDQDIQLIGNKSSIEYLIQLYIGSPEQAIKVIIDTGSNELWVKPNCTNLTASCDDFGFYDPSKSSTSNDTQLRNNVTYGDGSGAEFTYFTDTITLTTGFPVSNARFGVATSTTINDVQGILGVGFGESSANTDYHNFIDQLAAQQITNSKAFSLALGNEPTNNGGVIIFGGVDTKKFSGELISNDIVNDPGSAAPTFYQIPMTGLGISSPNGTSTNYTDSNATVIMDAGTTITILSDSTAAAVAKDINATNDANAGGYVVPCSSPRNDTFEFTFGDAVIRVPYADLLLPFEDDMCFWGIQGNSGGGFSILGLNFLRSAYVVFDQTLNTISLAQYVSCGTNEQPMPSSGAAGFMGECEAAVSNTTTPPPTDPSSAPSNPADPTDPGGPEGLSTGAKAGVGVGVAVGSLAIAGLLFWLIRKRRKGTEEPLPTNPELDGTPRYNTANLHPQELEHQSPHGFQYPYGGHATPMAEVPANVHYAEVEGNNWTHDVDLSKQGGGVGMDTTAPQLTELPAGNERIGSNNAPPYR